MPYCLKFKNHQSSGFSFHSLEALRQSYAENGIKQSSDGRFVARDPRHFPNYLPALPISDDPAIGEEGVDDE